MAEADNTSRENKNNTVLLYLAFLVERFGFRVSGLMTLRVGHTHSVLGR